MKDPETVGTTTEPMTATSGTIATRRYRDSTCIATRVVRSMMHAGDDAERTIIATMERRADDAADAWQLQSP